ncbi:hypothetical protein [Deinococcus sonorensis]|uniref:Uncharacterized protein n=2 Tax=Deinococcus sonorensis TaxID=309891 RepID=A0AAU7U487_9DEIO
MKALPRTAALILALPVLSCTLATGWLPRLDPGAGSGRSSSARPAHLELVRLQTAPPPHSAGYAGPHQPYLIP